jgi:radical SAM protein with 4Fe4S-binding SPASM domain
MYKLKRVALHITEKCSHDCPCCYYRKDRSFPCGDDPDRDFPLCTLKAIVDELGRNDVEEVYLLGGDPAEHPQILELAEYANGKHLVLRAISNTHAYKCDPLQLAKCLAICESTIHGHTKGIHDRFCRSEGAYERALTGLARYHDLGCTTGITVNVMPSNADHLYAIVHNILKEYGEILAYVNVQRIVPLGRAKVNNEYYLNQKHMLVALSQIERIEADFGCEIQCEDAFPLCLIPKKYWRFVHRCEWGYQKLSINGDGSVSRCGADPRYNLGNVLEMSLAEIWRGALSLKEFRRKQFLPAKCQQCPNLDICGGGCVLGCWSDQEFSADYLLADS